MPTRIPKVSVVILNYNGCRYLETYLPSVLQSTYPHLEIVVADNASSDGSVEFLEKYYPDVKIVRMEKNHGFSDGYNEGLRFVQADYYVLLNSDVEVTPGWIEPVIQYLEAEPIVGACQPKILSYRDRTVFEHAGACGGWMDVLGYPFCRGRVFGEVEKDLGQYDDIAHVFWASGAAMFVRASLFHELGGFDPAYFAHMEEIDFCWRMKRAGYSIAAVPQSVVYHLGGGTLDYDNPRKVYLNFRNSLFCLLKNKGFLTSWLYILLRLVLDGVAGLMFIKNRQWRQVAAIIRAHFHFYAAVPAMLRAKRRYNQLIRQHAIGAFTLEGVYKGSVVWQFFGRGKRQFSAITK